MKFDNSKEFLACLYELVPKVYTTNLREAYITVLFVNCIEEFLQMQNCATANFSGQKFARSKYKLTKSR